MSASAVQQTSLTFDMVDRNHDGVITREEFNKAVTMPTTTYAGAAPGAIVQQTAMMQAQPVVYSAPQQPVAYEPSAAPVMFSEQPQVTYSSTQPAQVVYEQAAPAVAYAAAPATHVTYQQAPAVTYAAPAASQVVHEQFAPAVTYATAPTFQVISEQPSPPVTYQAAPAAQATYEQTAVPTLISYPANAAPQATAQVSYPLTAVVATQQPIQYAGSSVEQGVPAAGSVSMMAPQPYMAPMLQPQAAYYQLGGMQAAAVQPQVTYGTTAPGIQTMMFEQQTVVQPCMAMTTPQMQQVPGSEPMMTVPAGSMEQNATVPQQTEVVAAPVMEQPAVVASKKAKKKLTTKKKAKDCC